MPTTRDFPLEQLHAERDAGLYVCRCEDPYPVELLIWNVEECWRCGRKVVS
jgi:hypothetical protein